MVKVPGDAPQEPRALGRLRPLPWHLIRKPHCGSCHLATVLCWPLLRPPVSLEGAHHNPKKRAGITSILSMRKLRLRSTSTAARGLSWHPSTILFSPEPRLPASRLRWIKVSRNDYRGGCQSMQASPRRKTPKPSNAGVLPCPPSHRWAAIPLPPRPVGRQGVRN